MRNQPAACSAASSWAQSPTTNSRAAENSPPSVSLLRPCGPLASPRGEARSWPSIRDRTAGRVPRRNKRGDAGAPPNPRPFLSPLLSPRDGGGHGDRGRACGGAAAASSPASALVGLRAPPSSELWTVTSRAHARAPPASRRRAEAPRCALPRRAAAGFFAVHRGGAGGKTQVSLPPLFPLLLGLGFENLFDSRSICFSFL